MDVMVNNWMLLFCYQLFDPVVVWGHFWLHLVETEYSWKMNIVIDFAKIERNILVKQLLLKKYLKICVQCQDL